MKKTVIALVTSVAAISLWFIERQRGVAINEERNQLEIQASQLEERIDATKRMIDDVHRQPVALKKEIERLETMLKNRKLSARDHERGQDLPEPDSNSRGGWPEGTDYFFLSKQHLAFADYKLLSADRLTDEASRLLGMTSQEREAVDLAFSDLLGRFGQLERDSMIEVEAPETWGINELIETDRHVVYEIPDLEEALQEERAAFGEQIADILGPSRAELLGVASDAYIRQNLDSLGSGHRTIGFFWQANGDGNRDLWYAISGSRFGPGSFHRVKPDYDPDSQMAYYARLLEIELPSE